MSDPRFRMRGPSAPPIERSEDERRALLDRLGRLREPRHDEERTTPSATPPAPGRPAARPRRRSAPRASRTDPTTTPPVIEHPPLPDRLREEARAIVPHDRSTESEHRAEPVTPPAPAEDRADRLRRHLRGEITPEERERDSQAMTEFLRERSRTSTPTDRERGLVPPFRAPRPTPERPLLLLPPDRFARRMDSEWDDLLEAHPDASPLGVLEGLRRVIADLLRSVASLITIIGSIPDIPEAASDWYASLTPEEQQDYQHLILLDREGARLLGEIIRSEIDNPEIMRALGDLLWEPIDQVAEHFVMGVREAQDGRGTESAARIIQGTFAFIDLLAAVEGVLETARSSPRLLARLAELRRRFSEAAGRARGALRRMADEFPLHPSGDGSVRRGARDRSREGALDLGGGTGRPRRVRGRTAAQLRSMRRRIRSRRLGRDSRRMERILTEHAAGTARSIPTDTFREWALDRISLDPHHPLWIFVDESTGTFRRPYGSGDTGGVTMVDHLNDFCVEMGHIVSRSSGEEERLALQWSYDNQMEGHMSERFGAFVDRGDAVDIGGVPVERRTAEIMEAEGLLAPGTVARSRPHPGFRLEDWSVEAGYPLGELVWTPR